MNAQKITGEIICTGNEIISGRVADLNARYAAARLHEAGLTVQGITFVGDNALQFQNTLIRGLGRSRFIIITGGLGPTEDDITAAAAAEVLQLPLHQDEVLLQSLRECFKKRGLPWEDRFARLALVPRGAAILDPEATACGFYLRHRDTLLYFLPGVPLEMQMLFNKYVLPPLLQLAAGGDRVCQRTLRFFGLHETELQQLSHEKCRLPENLCVGYYPNFPETHLTLTARGPDAESLQAALDEVTSDLAAVAGDAYLGVLSLEQTVGQLLRAGKLTLSVAESCSGGLICHRLTNVPGSSDYFLGGLITYSNQAKIDLLQVPLETLQTYGAVSAPTAEAMARGAAARFQADVALAVTGVAGPSGGSPEKPVGTVHLGLAAPQGVKSRHCLFHGSREEIKILTAQTALDWLRLELS